MTFFIRKSVSLGPLRFNLSKSGVGVSVGVKGLRLGTGPRGHYVYAGRDGLYYRHTLSPPARPSAVAAPAASSVAANSSAVVREIPPAEPSALHDSSSEALLDEIREKQQKSRLFLPSMVLALAGVAAATFLAVMGGWYSIAAVAVALLSVGAPVVAWHRDELKTTVVVLYDLDPHMTEAYSLFCQWAAALGASDGLWRIDAASDLQQGKRAGVSELSVRRSRVVHFLAAPGFMRTNVSIHGFRIGQQSAYFFPDRLLLVGRGEVGAVAYGVLTVEARTVRVLESESLPADAKVVDHTWNHLNKDGSPDRRFRSNPQLPFCDYEEVKLRANAGLDERLQASRPGVGAGFASALKSLAGVIPAGVAQTHG